MTDIIKAIEALEKRVRTAQKQPDHRAKSALIGIEDDLAKIKKMALHLKTENAWREDDDPGPVIIG